MIEIKCSISGKLMQVVEEVLQEWDSAPFSLVKDSDTGAVELHGYFNDKSEGSRFWKELSGYVKGLPEGELRELPDKDWQEAYKAYLKPWVYRGLHWVPVWERESYKVPVGESAVYLDAGMAFGTGSHETTRLCGMRLFDYYLNHKGNIKNLNIIDAGCGSGILALTALALGFRDIYAFDIDPDAIVVAKENAAANAFGDHKVDFKVCGLAEGLKGKKADLVMANIQADVLSQNRDVLIDAVRSGGELILSGILAVECNEVLNTFSKTGRVKQSESQVLGDWGDLRLVIV